MEQELTFDELVNRVRQEMEERRRTSPNDTWRTIPYDDIAKLKQAYVKQHRADEHARRRRLCEQLIDIEEKYAKLMQEEMREIKLQIKASLDEDIILQEEAILKAYEQINITPPFQRS
jgi:Skp family chaperone for outer membrane proteins